MERDVHSVTQQEIRNIPTPALAWLQQNERRRMDSQRIGHMSGEEDEDNNDDAKRPPRPKAIVFFARFM